MKLRNFLKVVILSILLTLVGTGHSFAINVTTDDVVLEGTTYKVFTSNGLDWIREVSHRSPMNGQETDPVETPKNEGFEGYLVELENDVDFSDCSEWDGIGGNSSKNQPFLGTFEGSGHSITINSKNSEGFYLFNTNQGVVKNFNVKGKISVENASSTVYVGVVKSNNSGGLIQQVTNECEITVSGTGTNKSTQIAGICSQNSSSEALIQSCINSGTIKVGGDFSGSRIGGIVGTLSSGKVQACTNEGTLEIGENANGSYAGGIVGTYSSGEVQACTNLGKIDFNSFNGGFGGIVGGTPSPTSGNGKISSCTNEGELSGVGTSGGIVGSCTYKIDILDCLNKGKISGSKYVGGISGTIVSGNINRCVNTGIVEGKSQGSSSVPYSGGIAGYTVNKDGVIVNCANLGKIFSQYSGTLKSGTLAAGGLIGYVDRGCTVENSYNSGDISAHYSGSENIKSIVGGITSYLRNGGNSDAYIKNCYNKGKLENEKDENGSGEICNVYYSGKIENCYWPEEGKEIIHYKNNETTYEDQAKLEENKCFSFNSEKIVSKADDQELETLLNEYVESHKYVENHQEDSLEKWIETNENETYPIFGDAYKVKINNPEQGGTVSSSEPECRVGTVVKLSVSPSEGYLLKSINITTDDGTSVELLPNNSFIMPNSDVSVTPVFEKNPSSEPEKLTVVYTGDGVTEETQYLEEGTITLKESPKRAGYTFLGWLCSVDNKLYSPGSQYNLKENVTFKAQWKKVSSGNSSLNVWPTGVVLKEDSLLMKEGDTSKLTAVVYPFNATDQTLLWTSSDTSVVKVDQNGNLTAVGVGKATITVTTINGIKASITVEVKNDSDMDVPVESLVPSDSFVEMQIGEQKELSVDIKPQNATDKALSWSSSDTSVVTVDQNGNLKAVGIGTAAVTVKSSNNVVATIVVKIKNDGIPVYRLYNRISYEHLYTMDKNESDVLSGGDWNYEGIGWVSPVKGVPVYRLYSPVTHEHLYTTDENEVKVLSSNGNWLLDYNERPMFYSEGTKSVFRLYNEELKMHLLTTDNNENNVLPNHGWKQEGIAFNCN